MSAAFRSDPPTVRNGPASADRIGQQSATSRRSSLFDGWLLFVADQTLRADKTPITSIFGRHHCQSGKTGSAETRCMKSLAYTPDVDEYIDEG
jgi:hypothetical protein